MLLLDKFCCCFKFDGLEGKGFSLALFMSKYDNWFEFELESRGDGVSEGSESEKLTFFFCFPLRPDVDEHELRAGDESRFRVGISSNEGRSDMLPVRVPADPEPEVWSLDESYDTTHGESGLQESP